MAIAQVACAGSTDSTVHVSPPSITRHPANQIVTAGRTATFTIVATTAPLVYRWQKGGVNIAGATSSSYTTATTAAHSGSKFDVIVSNSAGSVIRNAAAFTVNDHASPCLYKTESGGPDR